MTIYIYIYIRAQKSYRGFNETFLLVFLIKTRAVNN